MMHPIVFSLLAFVLAAAPASACEFLVATKNGAVRAETFDTVPDGVVAGKLHCGSEAYSAFVWTLAVDGDQPSLGIRDDKLHDTTMTGPLSRRLVARVGDHARLTVLERTETVGMARAPAPSGWFSFQSFFTFCEAGADVDPLDCSLGHARVKGWRKDEDLDRDGFLDVTKHEISYYDGASRLHFMNIVTPWKESVTAGAVIWIEALDAVSDALKPRKLASAAP